MPSNRRPLPALLIPVCVIVLAGGAVRFLADPPEPAPVSRLAPADDLIALLNKYVDGMAEGLESDNTFQSHKEILAKDAHAASVLAQALALYDQDHALKGPATAILAASRKLARATDFATAHSAYEELQKSLASPDARGEEASWTPVASMGRLMEEVAIVDDRVRRGMRRFDRRSADIGRDAALLAVIAQSVTFDTHEVKNPEQLPDWYKFAAQMRDAAASVGAAARAGNEAAASDALVLLGKSCDDCHEVFQDE